MIKKLAARVRQYKKQAIATPLFMVGEVAMEALIPMIMSRLIDFVI
jgi:ATP-binding cassette subfamily B protein